ncbi:MAG: glycosyltransferase [Spirochaetia bacterium]|nr:glycosyltransferase [Spirochaetia bacterium]
MAKADLHVHSKYSEHPSEWFLKKLGAAESYTEPEFIYSEAKEKGMTFATITDHNRIEGSILLNRAHPEDTFTGVEATTYFPEDGCKAHLLIYGLDEKQFEHIQKLRSSIYDLRDYIRDCGLAHSLAHATFSVNGRLTEQHLEKLILLFDTFEGINGSRDAYNNRQWSAVLSKLNPSYIDEIYRKHRIKPFSDTPWIKGFTGGSDDHAGIFIGKTFTRAEALTPQDFLNALRNKQTSADGRHNDFRGLAFAIYKIAYDFSKTKSGTPSSSLLSVVTEYIFENKKTGFAADLKIKKIKLFGRGKQDRIRSAFITLMDSLKKDDTMQIDDKLDLVYSGISSIADEFFCSVFRSFEKNLKKGDVISLIKSVSASIPGIFISAPFFTTLKHMYEGRQLIGRFSSTFEELKPGTGKRILWFTDTLNDLNGVSVTLKTLGWLARSEKKNVKLAACLSKDDPDSELPPDIMNFPFIYSVNLPYYEQYSLKVPSILTSIKMAYSFEPDEIYISTPGPIGLLGLLCAKLFGIKSTGIYHTDFTSQSRHLIKDESASALIEAGTRWFYSMMDSVQVPSAGYMNLLEERGFDRSKMSIFKRGIDSRLFYSRPGGKEFLKQLFGIRDGVNLIYTGRVSQDKNLDFMIAVYRSVLHIHPEVNLIITGDGPYLHDLKNKNRDLPGLYFAGKQRHQVLPVMLSGSDIFVFTSTTDTFGMAVLEAQACGLPAIVTDRGGPKEIILDKVTGFCVPANDRDSWTAITADLVEMAGKQTTEYLQMKIAAREHAVKCYDWHTVLNNLTCTQSDKMQEPEFTAGYETITIDSEIYL